MIICVIIVVIYERFTMTREQFMLRLKDLGIDKQEFSVLCGIPYGTINNWGILRDGKPLPVPAWVEHFLNYYEKSKKLEYVMSEICEKLDNFRG